MSLFGNDKTNELLKLIEDQSSILEMQNKNILNLFDIQKQQSERITFLEDSLIQLAKNGVTHKVIILHLAKKIGLDTSILAEMKDSVLEEGLK